MKEKEAGPGREAEMACWLSLWALGSGSASGSRFCPAVPSSIGHITVTEPVGSCQALPWHSGAQRVLLGILLFPQACAQICCLAAFPAWGLPLGQAGLGDSSKENSSHKIMDCDQSHKQGDSKALGAGPGQSFQPSQLGRRGWARPKEVRGGQ